MGLNLLDCVGIGTDGCALMESNNFGAVVEIQKIAKNASRCPYFNHALNLSFLSSKKLGCFEHQKCHRYYKRICCIF